jgi:error-prone DNA polymerase
MSYAELHCLTNFSFLEAASHPEELVAQADELGYAALAITDANTLAGVVRANTAAKDRAIKILVGAEIRPTDAPPLVLWATNRTGYGNLCQLITRGRRRAAKGQCEIMREDIAAFTEGLLAGVVPPARNEQLAAEDMLPYRELFGKSCYLLAELHKGPHDHHRLEWLEELSRAADLPLVAAGNVLFHVPARKVLHDVLTAIRLHTTVASAGDALLTNAERHLRPLDGIQKTFAGIPEAIRRTLEIAERCTFRLDELRYEYPEELAPPGLSPMQYLRQLTWHGAGVRFPLGVPEKVRGLLEHELKLIEELHYEPYFLTVWDLVRYARSKGILCQGRGSAANSAVCFCLGVTAVDPARVDMLFERFISRERDEAPDIDIDFEHERREEVLQYIYEKYGRDRAGIAAVTITYRRRSAIRDVGKAMGFSPELVDRLAKNADYHRKLSDSPQNEGDSAESAPARGGQSHFFGGAVFPQITSETPKKCDSPRGSSPKHCQEAGLDVTSGVGRQFAYLVEELLGFPRHLSQHVGGMVITRGPLDRLVPIENAAMEGRTVVQWNKDDLDDLGILKVDCLALGMLTAIRKCFALVEQKIGKPVTLATVPEGDPKVYDMICRADTMGVFQIESRAQMSMLPRLRPRCYYDLVIEVAIIRPGPIQGQMVHPYLRRRQGEEEPTYPSEAIRGVLAKTLGVPLFQEQCMQLAVVAAGFTPGEADQLRRAMGAWRRPGVIDRFRQRLLDGMREHGMEGDFAEQVFQQIRGFGEYGFPESHAASFALLVYVSAWLKHYYPAEFCAAIVNSQPMGFYAPAQLIHNARQHGVEIRPADVNFSQWDCTIEEGAVRLGLRMIVGLHEATAVTIAAARADGPFTTMQDFERRTRLGQGQVSILADADAFGSLRQNRRAALWNAMAVESRSRQQLLFDALEPEDDLDVPLPAMDAEEEVYADYRSTGFSLRSHPLAFRRERLKGIGVVPLGDLSKIANGTRVKVAGLVLLRQRPGTAKGITFVTIEDETGTANLIVKQNTWERFRAIAMHSRVWIAHGRVQSKDSVIHVLVHRLENLAARLPAINVHSRDFQ